MFLFHCVAVLTWYNRGFTSLRVVPALLSEFGVARLADLGYLQWLNMSVLNGASVRDAIMTDLSAFCPSKSIQICSSFALLKHL